jgi:hypothetical protein
MSEQKSETVLLFGCLLRFIKLDPKNPSNVFDQNDPRWEVQIYTYDSAQSKEWTAKGFAPKLKMEEVDGVEKPVYTVGLKKKVISSKGETNKPVIVRNGGLQPIDPNTIGYGSTANIRLFKWPYNTQGKKGIGFTLMELQVTKIIPFIPREHEDAFAAVATEYVDVPTMPREEGSDSDY